MSSIFYDSINKNTAEGFFNSSRIIEFILVEIFSLPQILVVVIIFLAKTQVSQKESKTILQ